VSGFYSAPVTEIAEHPRNVRRDVGDLTELTASIKAQGVLQPLTVAPDTSRRKTKFLLIAGHRRLRAAKKAGLAEVPVVVRDDLESLASQVAAMVGENVHRTDLSPVEEADAYQLLLDDAGLKVAEVAKATGRPQSTVRGRLKLRALPAAAQDLLHTGQMSLADAEALADLAADHPEEAAELARKAPADLRWEVQRIRRRAEEIAAADARAAELEAAGWRVMRAADLPKGWKGWDEVPPARVHGNAHYRHLAKDELPEQLPAGVSDADRVPCPDRVAVLQVGDGWVQVVTGLCAKPEQHQSTGSVSGASGGSSTPSPWEVEQQQRRAWQADRDTAAAVRRTWLHDLLAEGGVADTRDGRLTGPANKVTRLALVLPLLTFAGIGEPYDIDRWLRGLPGFPATPDEDDPGIDDDPTYSDTRHALSNRSVPTTALCLLMAQVEGSPQHQSASDSALWVEYWGVLAACGYELTPWETAEQAACLNALAATAAVDDPDVDEDDGPNVEDVVEDLVHNDREAAAG
jgi:ParB family chromosome partitioning protein